jgi:hypothetical protein
MSTIRIILPGNVTVETDVKTGTELLRELSMVKPPAETIDRIKLNNALLAPKVAAELESVENSKPAKAVKTIIADLPVTAQLTQTQREYLSYLFYYAPSKTKSKGKAAYVAAILMDREIHTVAELKKAANAPTATVTFAIQRFRQAGCTIETTTTNMRDKTLVQLTRMVKPKPVTKEVPVVIPKETITVTPPAFGFKNLTV